MNAHGSLQLCVERRVSHADLATMQEGGEGVIKLKANHDAEDGDGSVDDPEAIKLMIEYLYTANYEV